MTHHWRIAAGVVAAVTAACVGDSTGATSGREFVAISAGREHTCAVAATGQVWCWGGNAFGQLGIGTTDDSPVPTMVASTQRFSTVTAGFLDTCALTTLGRAWCWGSNVNGQVGDGTEERRVIPVSVKTSVTFTTISTGEAHTCAIAEAARAYCWGAPLGPTGSSGGRPPNQTTPIALSLEPVVALSAGFEIACAVGQSGSAYCWGRYAPGVQTDSAGGTGSGQPTRIFDIPALRSLEAGYKHACGMGYDDRAYCWGLNTSGQLGDGTLVSRGVPDTVGGDVRFTAVAAHSPGHSCGLTADGVAYCWGFNNFGQIGDGTTTLRSAPVRVAGDLRFRHLSAGFGHTCGITVWNEVYCWGLNGSGQLGTGDFEDTAVPRKVVGGPQS